MVGCNVIYINQLAAQCAPFVWRDFWLREGAYTGACLCFSRRDTIPFCQWWFYVIQLRRWMVLFSVLFMLYLLGCAAVVITQCDEVACALIVSTLSIKYKHTDTHTHAEHRINCDCLYTYIKTKHAADGNGFAHRFVVLLYLYFFWNVFGLHTLFRVCHRIQDGLLCWHRQFLFYANCSMMLPSSEEQTKNNFTLNKHFVKCSFDFFCKQTEVSP